MIEAKNHHQVTVGLGTPTAMKGGEEVDQGLLQEKGEDRDIVMNILISELVEVAQGPESGQNTMENTLTEVNMHTDNEACMMHVVP